MSWMDSWSRPNKHAATPPPLYLTIGDSVPYCHSCGRVISERKKHGATEVKYCSTRCRNNKPGPIDRKIEAAFAALLNGASPESLKEGGESNEQEKGIVNVKGKEEKKPKKKGSKSTKGDHRIILDCSTVEEVVFQRGKDPEKVYGRRKNRRARFVIEKPEDWRSVDMVDNPEPTPTTTTTTTNTNPISGPSASHPPEPTSDITSDSDSPSDDDDDDDNDGGIPLSPRAALPDTIEYGYGAGKTRPPQSQSELNGSIGGEKGWAERAPETDEMKMKRREGQQRADEREMVRKAARRGCAFGFAVKGEEGKRKCEAVMKGVVVEASFAKGEWGIRWREG